MTKAVDLPETIDWYLDGGRWVVDSRQLARLTAHPHGKILAAVRRASLSPRFSGGIVWRTYVADRNKPLPCCTMTREALVAVFGRLRGVRGWIPMGAVRAEYLRSLRKAKAPAPDSEIRPPDPEPADTLEPINNKLPGRSDHEHACASAKSVGA